MQANCFHAFAHECCLASTGCALKNHCAVANMTVIETFHGFLKYLIFVITATKKRFTSNLGAVSAVQPYIQGKWLGRWGFGNNFRFME